MPRIFSLLPPSVALPTPNDQQLATGTVQPTHFKGALYAIVDIRQVVLYELYSLVEATLIETAQVGQMDLQPPQAAFTERLSLCEEKESTRKVVTDVVQVRWDGVRPATEVHVVREIELVTQELRSDSRSQRTIREDRTGATYSTSDLDLVVDATPVRVIVRLAFTPRLLPCQVYRPRFLICLAVLRLLRFRNIIDHRRDLAHPFTRIPHLEDDVKNLSVDLPWSRAEDIQAGIDKLQISPFRGVLEVALLLLRVLEAHRRT